MRWADILELFTLIRENHFKFKLLEFERQKLVGYLSTFHSIKLFSWLVILQFVRHLPLDILS